MLGLKMEGQIIMSKIKTLLVAMALPLMGQAQVVTFVDSKAKADYTIYEVDYRYQADICYTLTTSRASVSPNVWFVSPYRDGIKLYKTNKKWEADLLVKRVLHKYEIKGETIPETTTR